MKTWSGTTYPIIIGHAGNTVANPVNTISAFDYVINHCEGFECDVCMTKDQIPVIIHGPTLQASTDTNGIISDTKHDIICTANASAKFKNGVHPATTVPTMNEIFDRYGGKCLIEFEIKDANTAPQVATMISQRGLQDYALVFTGDESVMAVVRAIDPTIKIMHAPTSFELVPTIAHLVELGCFAVSIYKTWLTQQYVNEAKAVGIKVQVSWLNTVKEVELYRSLNVDIILSDDPAYHNEYLRNPTVNLPYTQQLPKKFAGSGYRVYGTEPTSTVDGFGWPLSTQGVAALGLGIRTPDTSYKISFMAKIPNANPDKTNHFGIYFCSDKENIIPTRGNPCPQNGYNMSYQGIGTLKVTKNYTNKASVDIATVPFWLYESTHMLPMEITVTETSITILRPWTGDTVTVLDSEFSRSGWIGLYTSNQGVMFSDIKITEI